MRPVVRFHLANGLGIVPLAEGDIPVRLRRRDLNHPRLYLWRLRAASGHHQHEQDDADRQEDGVRLRCGHFFPLSRQNGEPAHSCFAVLPSSSSSDLAIRSSRSAMVTAACRAVSDLATSHAARSVATAAALPSAPRCQAYADGAPTISTPARIYSALADSPGRAHPIAALTNFPTIAIIPSSVLGIDGLPRSHICGNVFAVRCGACIRAPSGTL